MFGDGGRGAEAGGGGGPEGCGYNPEEITVRRHLAEGRVKINPKPSDQLTHTDRQWKKIRHQLLFPLVWKILG